MFESLATRWAPRACQLAAALAKYRGRLLGALALGLRRQQRCAAMGGLMSASGIIWQGVGRGYYLVGLGPLEAEVMRIVWTRHSVTVRDVYEELRLRRKIAYTTVLTVLRNLAHKGLVNQDESRLAYVYSPAVTEFEVTKAILDALVERLLGGNLEPLIIYLEQKGNATGTPA